MTTGKEHERGLLREHTPAFAPMRGTSRRFRLVAGWAVLAAFGLYTLYHLIHLLDFAYGRDQAIYAAVADAMLHGKALYREAWEIKTPGIYFLYASVRAVLGGSEVAPRIAEAAGFVSLVLAFALFSRRYAKSLQAGLLGGMLACITHVQFEFWHTGQPESYGAVLLAWALLCATYEPDPPDPRALLKQRAAWALSGALFFAAAMLKPPLGGGFVTSAILLVARRYRSGLIRSGRSRSGEGQHRSEGQSQSEGRSRCKRYAWLLEPVLSMTAGALLLFLLLLLYLMANDAAGDLWEAVVVFNRYYVGFTLKPHQIVGNTFVSLQRCAVGWSAFVPVGLFLFAAMRPLSEQERYGALHVLGIALPQIFGVALQSKFFAYHYGAAIPFAALLAGWGFWKLFLRLGRSAAGLVLFVVAILMLDDANTAVCQSREFWQRCRQRQKAWSDPSARQAVRDRLYTVWGVDRAVNRKAAAWVAAHTGRKKTVFVWGYQPMIYLASGRRPASRYLHNHAQRSRWPGRSSSQSALMRELARSRPEAILVAQRDPLPHTTGSHLNSARELARFFALRAFLEESYYPAKRIGYFQIYLRLKR